MTDDTQTQDPAAEQNTNGFNELQALKAKVEELTAQNAKLLDMAARAQADLQNAKARLEKDGDDIRKYASQAVLAKLLPLIDNFQRAFQHLPEDLKTHEWVKGVAAIEQDFIKQLGEMGLKKFDSLGQIADSSRHEVLMVGEGEEGVVTEVFEEGYELNGKVLRPAKVKVGGGN
jgi:molecular chaperone GrpE